MVVGQGPNWGCSAKEKNKIYISNELAEVSKFLQGSMISEV
jgi:hypothetical protein